MSELTLIIESNMFDYVSNKEIMDTIEESADVIIEAAIEHEYTCLDSLVHFCNTGKFLTEEE